MRRTTLESIRNARTLRGPPHAPSRACSAGSPLWADQYFELEDPLHELGPGVPTPLWGGWCERGGVVVFGVVVAVTVLRGLCVMVVVQRQRNDPIAVRRGRREDPVIGRQMDATPWDERGEAFDQCEWVEDDMRGPTRPTAHARQGPRYSTCA